jgi:hypothetical protein
MAGSRTSSYHPIDRIVASNPGRESSAKEATIDGAVTNHLGLVSAGESGLGIRATPDFAAPDADVLECSI